MTAIFYGINDFPTLVDATTLVIYFSLFCQVQFFLWYERKNRNPFILIMAYILIFFYFPRIVTLYWNDTASFSGVLARVTPTNVQDINYALLFILVANLFLFLGLLLVRRNNVGPTLVAGAGEVKAKLTRMIFILIFYLGIAIYSVATSSIFNTAADQHRLILVLQHLFAYWFFMPFLFVLLATRFLDADARLSRALSRIKVLAASLTTVYVIYIVYTGSRSALLSIVQVCFFVYLALNRYSVSRRALIAAFIMLAVSVPLFGMGTYLRRIHLDQSDVHSLGDVLYMLSNYVVTASLVLNDISVFLVPVFDRIAYLDFSVDLIKNAKSYMPVVNLGFYFESLVDSLTPGFDVYDTPRSANALSYIYYGAAEKISRINQSWYQSDQFSIYGEYYVIFNGWWSLPFFTIGAALFARTYSGIRGQASIAVAIWRAFIFSSFFWWINSFGTDWLIIEVVSGVMATALWLCYLNTKFVFRKAVVSAS